MYSSRPDAKLYVPALLIFVLVVILLAGCREDPLFEEHVVTRTSEQTISVETWAGSSKGYHNDKGKKARFNNPWGIALNSRGDLYIGDSDNASIRVIEQDQNVITLAGRGWGTGYLDGASDKALFYQPMGVALGVNGVLYIADSFNHAIRVVTPEGVVGTYAGTGVAGSRDGDKVSARFNAPSDIAISSNLTLYVTDGYNYKIRKVGTNGEVITLAGTGVSGHNDGPPDQAQFALPLSIALGPEEKNLYVADYYGHRIRKIYIPTGVVSTVVGNGEAGFVDGNLQDARLNKPAGIDIGSDGTIYFSDSGNHAIRMIRDDEVATLAGDGEPGASDGDGNEARFNRPYHLVLSQVETFLYISDWENHQVRRMRLR